MTLPVWYAAYAAAALVLALAGAAKVARPHDTARALRAAGLPGSPTLVRAGAAVEVVIGLAAVTTGARAASALVAASYLAFAIFVGQALRRHLPLATCGCLGEPDSPPTPAHVVIDLGLAAVAAVAVIDPVSDVGHQLRSHPGEAVVLVALVAVAVHLTVTVLTALAATTPGAVRR